MNGESFIVSQTVFLQRKCLFSSAVISQERIQGPNSMCDQQSLILYVHELILKLQIPISGGSYFTNVSSVLTQDIALQMVRSHEKPAKDTKIKIERHKNLETKEVRT